MRLGRWAGALLVLVLLLAVAGCSGGGQEKPASSSSAAGTTTNAAPSPAPRVGACYVLDVRAALRATSSLAPVSCSRRHTAVTVSVGRVQPVLDGHLLALDSTRVQSQIADRCLRSVDAYVGGSTGRQRLSRVQAVWFNPTPPQADRGALWYRCDLVVSSGTRAFAPLPRTTKGLLEPAGAMNRWGTCGTASPSSKHFQRVLCSAGHTWRARTTTTLPRGTAYLSAKATKAANSRCRDVAAHLSPNSTKLRWAFEWPNRDQWRSGQRYGFCWTPG
ncbi:MAG: septum formation family protein [Marmoricola sp.]